MGDAAVAESRNRAKKKPKQTSSIILRADTSLGAAAAEDDSVLLEACFEDAGHYKRVIDPNSRKFLIKGRTGSGKTALLTKVAREHPYVIKVDPEALCLEYISNSDIIRYLAQYDVAIENFFEIIWRHTFATELLRMRWSQNDLHDVTPDEVTMSTRVEVHPMFWNRLNTRVHLN